jgi:hypothetical protein
MPVCTTVALRDPSELSVPWATMVAPTVTSARVAAVRVPLEYVVEAVTLIVTLELPVVVTTIAASVLLATVPKTTDCLAPPTRGGLPGVVGRAMAADAAGTAEGGVAPSPELTPKANATDATPIRTNANAGAMIARRGNDVFT